MAVLAKAQTITMVTWEEAPDSSLDIDGHLHGLDHEEEWREGDAPGPSREVGEGAPGQGGDRHRHHEHLG